MVLNTDLKVGFLFSITLAIAVIIRTAFQSKASISSSRQTIMMDHTLRTISYIADIGDLLVLMARRRQQMGASANDMQNNVADKMKRIAAPKMICHVFESDEAQFIAQSIGQAFQVAYMVSRHGPDWPSKSWQLKSGHLKI